MTLNLFVIALIIPGILGMAGAAAVALWSTESHKRIVALVVAVFFFVHTLIMMTLR